MPYADSMGQLEGYSSIFGGSAQETQQRQMQMQQMQMQQQRKMMMMALLRQRAGRPSSGNQGMMDQMTAGGLAGRSMGAPFGLASPLQMPMRPAQTQLSPELDEMFRALK